MSCVQLSSPANKEAQSGKNLAKGQTASEYWRWDLNLGNQIPEC
jgi:hypothetical protein